jgi:hypothetical protein
MSVSGHTLTEEERLVHRDLFVGISIDGINLVHQQTGTASWLELPVVQTASEARAGNNPVATLSVLSHEGGVVRKLGTEEIDGVDCFGFSATPTEAMMVQAQKREAAALGLTAAQQAQIVSQVKTKPPTISVWIDPHHLLRQMNESIQITQSSVGSGTGQIVLNFRNYGAAIHIPSPPRSEVIPFQEYVSQQPG